MTDDWENALSLSLCVSLSYKHTVLCLLTKYEINGTSKIPISKLFSDLEKIWKWNLGLYSKNLEQHSKIFFINLEKSRSPARATFKNPKISLLIGKNLEVQPKTNTQKIPIWNLWRNWENLYPYLSFTAENKIDNLHKIRLFTFQT